MLYHLEKSCQWRCCTCGASPNLRQRLATSISGNGATRTGPGQDSILSQVLKKIGWRGPTKQWTERADQLRIVDSQSVKNTDTAGHKGYDAGKKVSGIKRHIAVHAGLHVHDTRDYRRRHRPGWALWRCLTGAETASVKSSRTCWWTGVTPESPLPLRCKACWEPRWKRGETQRTAHLRGASEAMGGGAVFRLAGKVPPTLEELRKATQPANGGACRSPAVLPKKRSC